MAQASKRIQVEISPDILDTIGKTFKFKHPKGIAEWLKNSLDQYLRLVAIGQESRTGNWPVYLCLLNGATRKSGPNLALIDFGGTSYNNVKNFFLLWGSRSAASHGGVNTAAVTGGHGNGGKFYMREMWRDGARLMTWREGKVTSLVVEKNKDGTTGYWEKENITSSWREALQDALSASDDLGSANSIITHLEQQEQALVQELDNGQRGITVVVGRRAVQVQSANDVVTGGHWDTKKLVEEIRGASQARRPIRELAISVFVDGIVKIDRLQPETVDDDPNWKVETIQLPLSLLEDETLKAGATEVGSIVFMKSATLLSGRLKDHNAVFVSDAKSNPIAYYPMSEIPLPPTTLSGFLHAELKLTFPQTDDLVENDRERLVKTPTTAAILAWIGEKLGARIKIIEEAQRAAKNSNNLQIASILNEHLNNHAKEFLKELETMILVDVVTDDKGGGPGKSGSGTGHGDGKSSDGGDSGRGGSVGEGGSMETPGTTESVKRPRFPQVLLSSSDMDPANPGQKKVLSDRHPPLYQDDTDKRFNIWWINTSHTFAVEAMKRGGPKGAPFRNHHLFMFRDVVQREVLRLVQKREAELGIDVVETELDRISDMFLGNLPVALVTELLD
jgi:hypothetical protein